MREGDVLQHRGQVEFLHRADLRHDDTHHQGRRAEMAVDIAAESAEIGDRVGEVNPFEDHPIEILGSHAPGERDDERLQLFGGQRRGFDRPDRAIDPQIGDRTGLEVQVRGALLDRESDQLIEFHVHPRV